MDVGFKDYVRRRLPSRSTIAEKHTEDSLPSSKDFSLLQFSDI